VFFFAAYLATISLAKLRGAVTVRSWTLISRHPFHLVPYRRITQLRIFNFFHSEEKNGIFAFTGELISSPPDFWIAPSVKDSQHDQRISSRPEENGVRKAPSDRPANISGHNWISLRMGGGTCDNIFNLL
jgi:hypothetical protein